MAAERMRGWLFATLILSLLGLLTRLPPAGQALQKPQMRIVSMAPSNTELLYSIGAGDLLVGICNQCNYPQACKSLPVVGTFVSPNIERLASRAPNTVVLVSGQEPLAGLLAHNGFHTVILNNNKLKQISQNILELGQLSGKTQQAAGLSAALSKSLSSLQKIISQARVLPHVFYCVWPEPLMTAGNQSFLNDVITACGGINIAASLAAAYPHYSLEKLVLADPEIIIFPHQNGNLSFLQKQPWSNLRAAKAGKVFPVPAEMEDKLSRPTLRIVEGLYWLSLKLHPELSRQLDNWVRQSRVDLNLPLQQPDK